MFKCYKMYVFNGNDSTKLLTKHITKNPSMIICIFCDPCFQWVAGLCEWMRADCKSDLIRRYTRRHRRRCSHNRYRPRFALKPRSLNHDLREQVT